MSNTKQQLLDAGFNPDQAEILLEMQGRTAQAETLETEREARNVERDNKILGEFETFKGDINRQISKEIDKAKSELEG